MSAGTGFHSNDARGATISRNATGEPADPVTPLVRAKGSEVGFRTVAIPRVQTTAVLWRLDLASELVFVGVEDVHTHPALPRTLRAVLRIQF